MNNQLSRQERIRIAKGLFKHEFQVAMSARTRKPIDYSYLDEALKEVKRINDKSIEEVIQKDLNGPIAGMDKTDGQTTGGSGN